LRFKRVIAVNPPNPPGFVANRDSMGGYGQLYPAGATILPPLDLPYLAAYLIDKGVQVEVLEAQGLELDVEHLIAKLEESVKNHPEPSLVVVRLALCSLDWDLSVCDRLKKATHAAVAIWGSVLPHVGARLLETTADYIVHNEPDETVWELVTGRNEEEILGLQYRRGPEWFSNADRPLAKDLDAKPFPKWELLPYRRYATPRSSTTGSLPFLPILTSRGCPFGCHYCPYPVGQGLPFRYRSPKNVVDEIEHLVRDLGIKYILFRDPMFSLRQSRVIEICEEINKRDLRFKWKCETRPDCLDEKTLRAMAQAGCDGINFGVESADVEIQQNSGRKPISREQIIQITSLCRRLGIKTFCFFIIGLPGDTTSTILDTIGFAVGLRANWIQFTAASPLVGTKLRDWAIATGLVSDDTYAYRNSHETMIGNENLHKSQIQSLYRFASFFERYLINRAGLFKDDSREGLLYSAARGAANFSADLCARMVFAVGRAHFERSFSTTH
jgi:anaerobic magnesium-protoporphyrin IX monomethyl ester cyclase